jgi:hypothetical protein
MGGIHQTTSNLLDRKTQKIRNITHIQTNFQAGVAAHLKKELHNKEHHNYDHEIDTKTTNCDSQPFTKLSHIITQSGIIDNTIVQPVLLNNPMFR